MATTTTRVKDIPTTATTAAPDDYFVIDGATNGTRKYDHNGDAAAHGLAGRPYVSLLGDSITVWHRYTATTAYQYYFNIANGLLGLPFEIAGVYAAGGKTPANLVSEGYLASALADRSKIVIVHAGTNGITEAGGEWATVVAIWDAIIAAGKICVGTSLLPRSDNAVGISVANRHLKSAAAIRRMVFVDWSGAIIDHATGGIAAALALDTQHPNLAGHYLLGLRMKAAISHLCAGSVSPLPSTNSECLSPNPLLLGSGNRATSIITTGNGTLVEALVPRADGLGNWQQVGLSGSTGSRLYYLTLAAIPAAGTVLKAVCEYDATGDTQFTTKKCTLRSSVGSTSGGNAYGVQITDHALAMESPPYTVTGAETYIRAEIELQGNGTARFGRLGVVTVQ